MRIIVDTDTGDLSLSDPRSFIRGELLDVSPCFTLNKRVNRLNRYVELLRQVFKKNSISSKDAYLDYIRPSKFGLMVKLSNWPAFGLSSSSRPVASWKKLRMMRCAISATLLSCHVRTVFCGSSEEKVTRVAAGRRVAAMQYKEPFVKLSECEKIGNPRSREGGFLEMKLSVSPMFFTGNPKPALVGSGRFHLVPKSALVRLGQAWDTFWSVIRSHIANHVRAAALLNPVSPPAFLMLGMKGVN